MRKPFVKSDVHRDFFRVTGPHIQEQILVLLIAVRESPVAGRDSSSRSKPRPAGRALSGLPGAGPSQNGNFVDRGKRQPDRLFQHPPHLTFTGR